MIVREVPASIGQRLLSLMSRYRPGEAILNCPIICRVRGRFDRERIEAALAALTHRHESLRTTYAGGGHRLMQRIHAAMPVTLNVLDLSTAGDPETTLQRLLRDEQRSHIDAEDCPMRVTVWRLTDSDHMMCINVTHFATDAWSGALLFNELCQLLRGRSLLPVRWQYADFSAWQSQMLQGEKLRSLQSFWRQQLASVQYLNLNAQAAQAPGGTRSSASSVRHIPAEAIAALAGLARANRTTLFAVMLAVFYTLLNRRTGSNDLAVASLFANRLRPEVQNTLGFFANLVVLRTSVPSSASFPALLQKAHAVVMRVIEHQALPFQMLPAELITTDSGRADDIIFQMLPGSMPTLQLDGASIEAIAPDEIPRRFEMELTLCPDEKGMNAILFFDGLRIQPGWAAGFVAEYCELACQIAAQATSTPASASHAPA